MSPQPSLDADQILRVALVVPCYNEAKRLDAGEFVRLSRSEDRNTIVSLLFVDDGSRDATNERLRHLQTQNPLRIDLLELARNRGKGEAVRLGLLRALRRGADVVGYLDADLSMPVDGMLALLELLRSSRRQVVLGARVTMLGREIERKAFRHYLGRVFASAASLVLGTRVYDTQCGGKLFRRSPALEAALSEPFISRWAFDVELLGRLLSGHPSTRLELKDIVEHPVQVWRDKAGSKVTVANMVAAAGDLLCIAVDLTRRRRSQATVRSTARCSTGPVTAGGSEGDDRRALPSGISEATATLSARPK